MHNSISFKDALTEMLASAPSNPAVETVSLLQAPGRILASDIRSDVAMPPFDKSAVDGFACRGEDLLLPLTIIGEIPAGVWPELKIDKGQCARIMTGAPVPQGASQVVMIEDTAINADGTVSVTAPQKSSNICRYAEDVKTGDILLQANGIITAAHCAVLAMTGAVGVPVFVRPSVAVLSTGSELVDAAIVPKRAQIRNSNGPQLCAQVASLGLPVVNHGIVTDTLAATVAAIELAQKESAVILMSGGVSEGAHDYVPEALIQCGYTVLFCSVAMQPGRPMVFARGPRGYVCALPGNPVATFMVFELLVKPFLYALMGHHWHPCEFHTVLSTPFSRRDDRRQSAVPVRRVGIDAVELIEYHGSAHINAMTCAEGILLVPVGVKQIPKGATVVVRFF